MAGPERVVIDASIALDWFDPSGRGAYATPVRQAIDEKQIQPIAPTHFDFECAAVLMRWYRSEKITRALLEFSSNQLAALQIQIHAYPSNAAERWPWRCATG